jgi:hypothetical protein
MTDPRAESGRRGSLGWALAALVLIGFFALKEAIFWNPPLRFSVGASAQDGVLHDWEEAPDDARLPIRFSNGTLIELEPRARARVEAVGRAGAAIALESGRAHVSIVPAAFRVPGEMPWHISLGAFSVEVRAARFDLGWDPRSDELTLDLIEGTVSIEGCEGGRSHLISAAQGARATCDKEHWSLLPLDNAGPSEPPATDLSAPTPTPPTATAPTAS